MIKTSNGITKTLTEKQKKYIEKLDMVSDCFPEIEDTDIQTFRNAGYDGQIYEVYKYNLNLTQSTVSAGIATGIFGDSPYILEPLGTLVVNEAFLESKFGELKYLERADNFHPTGVIITDYLADIILLSGQVDYADRYEELIGPYHWGAREENSFLPQGRCFLMSQILQHKSVL